LAKSFSSSALIFATVATRSSYKVKLNRHRGDLARVEVGMTLALQGRFDSATTGEANRVEYRCSLIGRINAINLVDNSFTAKGQTVSIDGDSGAAANEVLLRGPLADAAKAASQLSIIAVPVTVDRATEFRDSSSSVASPLSFDSYFDLTQTGSIVKITGQRAGTALIDARGAAGGKVEVESKP
jgi:Domain of unknown function (DUF5666)